jgi:hypothetical protein
MKKKLVLSAIIAVIFGGVLAAYFAVSTRSQTKDPGTGNDVPTISIDKLNSDSLREGEIRTERGKKYSEHALKIADNERSPESMELPISHAPYKKAFPTVESDAIAIGAVTKGEAFFSNDKTTIYSEFGIKIEEVFKSSDKPALSRNMEITAERMGGAVRFSNGNVQRRGKSGEGLPAKGGRYLLFLKWNEEGKDFVIITGYRLEKGKVFPLDGWGETNSVYTNSVYKNFFEFRDADESYLLKRLKEEIAHPSLDEIRPGSWRASLYLEKENFVKLSSSRKGES